MNNPFPISKEKPLCGPDFYIRMVAVDAKGEIKDIMECGDPTSLYNERKHWHRWYPKDQGFWIFVEDIRITRRGQDWTGLQKKSRLDFS